MNYYGQLLKLGCFSHEDVTSIIGNANSADSLIRSYKKKGWITSVRRNLFVALNLETQEPARNPYQIASCISADSYISHHTAFEYHGMANQVFADIYVSSSSKFNDFEFDGKSYRRIASKTKLGVKTVGGVRVTDLERTVVDNIKDFAKIGGFEELLHCLSMVTYLSEERLIEYLTIYDNQFLWQKTGYLLSCFPNTKLSDDFFGTCHEKINKSIRYLYEDLKYEDSAYISKWCIYVPHNITALISEGGEALV